VAAFIAALAVPVIRLGLLAMRQYAKQLPA